MNMMDFVKKSVAFGVGAAAFSAEKLRQFADDMVARGEMTSDEASRFVDDMTKKADEEKKSLQDWMRDQMTRMMQQAGVAEAARVEALERRLAALERKVAGLAGEPTECAAVVEVEEEAEDAGVPPVSAG